MPHDTGFAIRAHRLRLGLGQSELARRAGISASYFNQIELGHRRIGGKRLSDIAAALGIGTALLGEEANAGLIEVLREAAATGPDVLDPPDGFAARYPGWARLLADRHRHAAEMERQVAALNDRLAHDRGLADTLHELISTVTAIHAAASILADDAPLDPNWRNRFQRNIIEDSARLARGAQALVDRLDSAGATAQGPSPRDMADAFLDRHGHAFAELERDGCDAVEPILAAQIPPLPEPAAALARENLHRMAEDAEALPLARVAAALAEHGPDPVAIARHARADLPRVLRRLATLPEGVLRGPVGLAVCDMSGALTFRREPPGFALPRDGTFCALWPLFLAMAQPLRPIRRALRLPGRDPVMTWTVAAPVEDPGVGEDLRLVSHMLILPGETAAAPVHEVGPTCRQCVRQACPARREPAMPEGRS